MKIQKNNLSSIFLVSSLFVLILPFNSLGAEYQKYSNREHGFVISFPKTWFMEIGDLPDVIVKFYDPAGLVNFSIGINKLDKYPQKEIAETVTAPMILNQYRSNGIDAKLLTSKNFLFRMHPAIDITIQRELNDSGVAILRQIITYRELREYTITFGAAGKTSDSAMDNFNKNLDVLNRMLDSFHFTGLRKYDDGHSDK
ncbi:hypothetical protein ACFL9U_10685 [Thermodesulfobacteriota bacterium]